MAHEFVYFDAKGTVVRACKFCTCSAVLIGTQKDMSWESVLEQDGTQIMADEECGEKVERGNGAKRDTTKRTGYVKKSEPCYCDTCKGSKSHYVDSSDCYCKGCRGRKTHY